MPQHNPSPNLVNRGERRRASPNGQGPVGWINPALRVQPVGLGLRKVELPIQVGGDNQVDEGSQVDGDSPVVDEDSQVSGGSPVDEDSPVDEVSLVVSEDGPVDEVSPVVDEDSLVVDEDSPVLDEDSQVDEDIQMGEDSQVDEDIQMDEDTPVSDLDTQMGGVTPPRGWLWPGWSEWTWSLDRKGKGKAKDW